MFPEMIVALIAFLGLIVAWVVLPTRSRTQTADRSSEIETA